MLRRKHFLLSQLEEKAPGVKWVKDVNHPTILRQQRLHGDTHALGGMSILHIGTSELRMIIFDNNKSGEEEVA